MPVPQIKCQLGPTPPRKTSPLYTAANFDKIFLRTFMPRFSLVSGQKQAQVLVFNPQMVSQNSSQTPDHERGQPRLPGPGKERRKHRGREEQIHINTHIHVFTSTCTCPYIHVFVYIYIYIYIYAIHLYLSLYIYTYLNLYARMYVCMHACMRACMCVN